MRLTKTLSQKVVEERSIISKENEKNQQDRIFESAKLLTHIEEVRTALQEKLDAIMHNLAVHRDLQRGQFQNLEALEVRMKEHQITLSEIHASVEDCAAGIASMVVKVEIMRNEARDPRMMQGAQNWLGQFARLLAASGIASATTAVVVMIAIRSEAGHSEERRSSNPSPGAVLPQDDDFASKARSNRSPNDSELSSQPLNPSTSRMPSQSSQAEITPTFTAAEDRNTVEHPLIRHDTSLTENQTAPTTLLPVASSQSVYRNPHGPKYDSSKPSSSSQALSEKSSLTRDQSNQPTKTTINSNPTTTYTSNLQSPGQSIQSSSNKTKTSSSLSRSSNYTTSYSNDTMSPSKRTKTGNSSSRPLNYTTSYSNDITCRTSNSLSSLESHQSCSRERENYDDSMLNCSNASVSYSAQHRYPNQIPSKAEIEWEIEWDWDCCHCFGGPYPLKALVLFERCPHCNHLRDFTCRVNSRLVKGSSSSCRAKTLRR